MAIFKDITGQTFGRLTAMWPAGRSKVGRTLWLHCCECGNYVVGRPKSLRSCGCLTREGRVRHGASRRGKHSSTYASWQAMKTRCHNPKNHKYKAYGAKGVTVCDRWKDSFEAFLADMGERPPRTTIDRFPNKTGNYEPGNCRWATPAQQSANRRSTVLTPENVIDIRTRQAAGESSSSIARAYGVCSSTIRNTANRTIWRSVA